MNIKQIIAAIKDLAASQGFYSRLYNAIKELQATEPEQFERLAAELEAQKFNDVVDMVLYFEC